MSNQLFNYFSGVKILFLRKRYPPYVVSILLIHKISKAPSNFIFSLKSMLWAFYEWGVCLITF